MEVNWTRRAVEMLAGPPPITATSKAVLQSPDTAVDDAVLGDAVLGDAVLVDMGRSYPDFRTPNPPERRTRSR
jgi:hypothetical protein